MSDWQIVSLITLLAWLALAVSSLARRNPGWRVVLRSILAWAGIALVVAIFVINRSAIAEWLAPIRAVMP